jgi:hypothetical protein
MYRASSRFSGLLGLHNIIPILFIRIIGLGTVGARAVMGGRVGLHGRPKGNA